MGFDMVKLKTMKFVFVASTTKHAALTRRAKTGWLGIRTMYMYQSGATSLSADYYFTDLAL